MEIYAGTFLLALVMLALEITLTRILSVVTWYHLAFFAVSTAMLGMTAGATIVYLYPRRFASERLQENLGRTCLRFAIATPVALVMVCIIPVVFTKTFMSLFCMLGLATACALPFYYAGIAITLVLTKCTLPVGKVYASDLIGASAGCFLVLGGLEILDAASLILLCGSLGAFAGFVFVCKHTPKTLRTANLRRLRCVGSGCDCKQSISLAGATIYREGPHRAIDRLRYRAVELVFANYSVSPVLKSEPRLWSASPLRPKRRSTSDFWRSTARPELWRRSSARLPTSNT